MLRQGLTFAWLLTAMGCMLAAWFVPSGWREWLITWGLLTLIIFKLSDRV